MIRLERESDETRDWITPDLRNELEQKYLLKVPSKSVGANKQGYQVIGTIRRDSGWTS